eukprot:TRINITY_DN10176_c1_g1_i10.p1 TRINITY_DN10176_c1_g1~~TRINITY_DN10176_c1_g1_i10.p1  ORF type:complete len:137 (-),score=20.82 TRINITY_DN10176_c1_g1_i10:877-1287(-)
MILKNSSITSLRISQFTSSESVRSLLQLVELNKALLKLEIGINFSSSNVMKFLKTWENNLVHLGLFEQNFSELVLSPCILRNIQFMKDQVKIMCLSGLCKCLVGRHDFERNVIVLIWSFYNDRHLFTIDFELPWLG